LFLHTKGGNYLEGNRPAVKGRGQQRREEVGREGKRLTEKGRGRQRREEVGREGKR